ncbi:MAG TPA: TonB-dependent receptor [Rhizomicrobium sp.]
MLSVAWGLALGSAQVFAQDNTDTKSETVVVTGSRLGTAGVNTPTPVTAVAADVLQASAPSNIADALNNLPSMLQSGGQQNNSGSTSTGKNLLNLRGLGRTRTLVLLDGMRFPSTQNDNTVDVNVLPQALVKRVDIVTGGASASYGSDAVAGAVNFVLNNSYEGIGGQLSGGISQYGDNEEVHANVNFGHSFLGGRLHVLGSVDYIDNYGAAGDSREFRRTDANVIASPATGGYTTTFTGIPNLRSVSSFGGYVSAAAGGSAAQRALFTNLQFNNAGQLVPYNPGTVNDGSFQNGGDGVNTAIIQDLSRPLRRRSAFLRGEYDFSDDTSAFLQWIYGHSDAEQNDGEFAVGANALTIRPDNPFLSPALATQLQTAGVTSLTVTKYFPYNTAASDPGTIEYKNNDRMTTNVVMTGVNGKFGQFSWGASAQYGYTREYTSSTQALNLVNLALAADATRNASGQIVCRSTLTNPNNGCVPANIFGTNNLSDSAISYFTDHNPIVFDNETESAEFHVNGPIFELPAGPVAAAVGGEYRRQRDVVIANALSVAKVFQLGTVQPWQGGYDVTEGFAEAEFPILADLSFAKSLDLNLAARETNYSIGGAVTTWKAGLVYKLNDDVTFRTTVSRDIRAPNPSDLFNAGAQGTTNVIDPFNGNVQDRGIRQGSVGNTALKPERGTTITGGVAYTPSWAEGLSLTVDYYDIRVAGVIATPATQSVINFCFEGNNLYCQFIQRNSAGVITGVTVSNQNLNAQRTNGVDLEADYNVPADDWFDWWKGNLTVRTVANYLGLLTTGIPGSQSVYNAGNIGFGTPHWRGQMNINYDLDAWSTFLQVRFIGAGLWNNLYNNPTVSPYQTTDFNNVNTATYFDLQETYHFNDNLAVYLNIQNVFNLQPQFAPSNSNYAQTTNEGLYDQIGRMFRVGVRFNY